MASIDRAAFDALAAGSSIVPVVRRVLADQLSPVSAYRRLVRADDRTAPSFLFESVEGGGEVGRWSLLGSSPAIEIVAHANAVVLTNHETGERSECASDDPLGLARAASDGWSVSQPLCPGDLPLPGFTGGWVGYAGYDTARYGECEQLPFSAAPEDDRGLPDLHLAFYRTVVVFDHVAKVIHVIHNADATAEDPIGRAEAALDEVVSRLQQDGPVMAPGAVDIDLAAAPQPPTDSSMTREAFESAVERCRKYIADGDIFQVVLSQRFQRRAAVDPFEIYRALRVVNPSPYMIYLQAKDNILVASSPEILCRCRGRAVTSRPLAGTRRRGADDAEDAAMEAELRGDPKERAEHVMLVDLGRNDLGTVCELGSIELPALMDVERYSHVMHLSSTITGTLAEGKDCWDALAATLPVGTVSGAPKIRAMQIIDELEPLRRGPYAGGIGWVALGGDMDMAIALRTMVVPTAQGESGDWRVDLQAGAGIVIDSQPALEWQETINKAAALGRAIDLAEAAFTPAGE